MKIKGRAWKFGDNIDTDYIIPARFLNVSDHMELARNCFADQRPGFHEEVRKGDILVGGRNFGCGSSREHAPLAIKESGISAIIAKSVARIFYRNSFNIGLPILESEDAVDSIEEGDQISVNLATGEIVNRVNDGRFFSKPIPEFMAKIIQAGGLVEFIKKESA
jgi:3-isopropylmalate/(R)-2-methylmalate dehydratase small subunit